LKLSVTAAQLTAIRHLFDWLVVGQVMAANPATSVRGPSYSIKTGKTATLTAQEARTLVETLDVSTLVGLRDRALIALMVYTFARVSAALKVQVKDVYVQGSRLWVRLHEKGGKYHEMPCHHSLEVYLKAHLNEAVVSGDDCQYLFRTAVGRSSKLSNRAMSQVDAYRMIRRRASDAKILTKVGNHSFRATGITEYLRNGGKLEIAQQMANHESSRTTGLYDRRSGCVSLEEIERIVI
jgi:site-specific recombinase XerD